MTPYEIVGVNMQRHIVKLTVRDASNGEEKTITISPKELWELQESNSIGDGNEI